MSNTDEQQYNGSQYFPSTANVGTGADVYLIPTDGPVVTADSNLTDEAPVNLSLKKNKDTTLGLRGAIFGDFAGAVRKTLKSLEVDGAGANTSTLPSGEIQASSNITSTAGDLLAPSGACSVGGDVNANGSVFSIGGLVSAGNPVGEHSEQTEAKYKYFNTGTGANDANPPQGTDMANELRAINIAKCAAYIEMTVAGAINSFDGHGVQSVAIDGGNISMTVTFKTAFVNTLYTFKPGPFTAGGEMYLPVEFGRTTTQVQIALWKIVAGAFVDFSAQAVSFSVAWDGRQTT